jgi:hypothetical protein
MKRQSSPRHRYPSVGLIPDSTPPATSSLGKIDETLGDEANCGEARIEDSATMPFASQFYGH